jgi:DNA repair protein RecO (recombination protein O)
MVAPRLYKTEAIVLRQRRLGEADAIVTLYTPNYGKLEAKAKGVRKTKSRMAGHLQPLTRCAVQLAQGHTIEVVAGCQAIEAFPALRENLERLSCGLYVTELVDRFAPERVESFATYQLLLDTLRRLAQETAMDAALRYFEMRLLDYSGFQPELERCLGCEAALSAVTNYFSPAAGGVLCPRCGQGQVGARPLSVNALKVLRHLRRGTWSAVAPLRLPAVLAQEVERHLRAYIVYVLERDVNAAAFIERLRREGMGEAVKV